MKLKQPFKSYRLETKRVTTRADDDDDADDDEADDDEAGDDDGDMITMCRPCFAGYTINTKLYTLR